MSSQDDHDLGELSISKDSDQVFIDTKPSTSRSLFTLSSLDSAKLERDPWNLSLGVDMDTSTPTTTIEISSPSPESAIPRNASSYSLGFTPSDGIDGATQEYLLSQIPSDDSVASEQPHGIKRKLVNSMESDNMEKSDDDNEDLGEEEEDNDDSCVIVRVEDSSNACSIPKKSRSSTIIID